MDKYAIDTNSEGWSQQKKDLEKAAKNGKGGVVSLKTGTKKRGKDTAENVYTEEMGALKKTKKSKKAKN